MLSISLTPAGCQQLKTETARTSAENAALLTAASRAMTASSNLDLRAYWSTVYGKDGLARAEEALEKLLYDLAPGSCTEGMAFGGTYPAKQARGKADLYYRDLTIRNRAKGRVPVSGGCINFLLKDLTRQGILERLRLGPQGRLYYRMPMRFEIADSSQIEVGIFPLDNAQTFVDNEPVQSNTCSIGDAPRGTGFPWLEVFGNA